jgi:hypothetical protein
MVVVKEKRFRQCQKLRCVKDTQADQGKVSQAGRRRLPGSGSRAFMTMARCQGQDLQGIAFVLHVRNNDAAGVGHLQRGIQVQSATLWTWCIRRAAMIQ